MSDRSNFEHNLEVGPMTNVMHNGVEALHPLPGTMPLTPADPEPESSHEATSQTLRALLDAGSQRAWAADALCTNKTHLFFAPPGERMTRRNKREALANAYCEQCTVSQECRTWARENRESGFWGGENEEQRAAAGFAPRSPNRRAVAIAARAAREAS